MKSLLHPNIPRAISTLGQQHHMTLVLRHSYATALYADEGPSLDDLIEAATTLESVVRTARRVFGDSHPHTESFQGSLAHARKTLAAARAS